MTEVIYYVACSIDGFIAPPEGGIDWLTPFDSPDEDYGYAAFYDSVDSIIVGSRTFEQSLSFGDWPYPGKPVWVFSSQPPKVDRADVTTTAQAPDVVMGELGRGGFHRAWLVGGGTLAGSFERAGLITEYIISVIPVVLGRGIPLFGDVAGHKTRLRLLESHAFPNGVCQLHYASDDGGQVPVR